MNAAVILQGIIAALTAAPKVAELAIEAKKFIEALFTNQVITAEQQNAMKAEVDAIVALSQAGIVPSHWQVEPDPQ